MKNCMIKIECAYIKISGITNPNYLVGIANPVQRGKQPGDSEK